MAMRSRHFDRFMAWMKDVSGRRETSHRANASSAAPFASRTPFPVSVAMWVVVMRTCSTITFNLVAMWPYRL